MWNSHCHQMAVLHTDSEQHDPLLSWITCFKKNHIIQVKNNFHPKACVYRATPKSNIKKKKKKLKFLFFVQYKGNLFNAQKNLESTAKMNNLPRIANINQLKTYWFQELVVYILLSQSWGHNLIYSTVSKYFKTLIVLGQYIC